jgi:hypothetical protein
VYLAILRCLVYFELRTVILRYQIFFLRPLLALCLYFRISEITNLYIYNVAELEMAGTVLYLYNVLEGTVSYRYLHQILFQNHRYDPRLWGVFLLAVLDCKTYSSTRYKPGTLCAYQGHIRGSGFCFYDTSSQIYILLVLSFKFALCVCVFVTEYDHSGVLYTVEQIYPSTWYSGECWKSLDHLWGCTADCEQIFAGPWCPQRHQQNLTISLYLNVVSYRCYSYMYTLHIDYAPYSAYPKF